MVRKAWAIAALATAAALAVAAPALATVTRMWLIPSQTLGYYGQDLSLTPSIDATPKAGDKVEFQFLNAAGGWEKLEDQVAEVSEETSEAVIDPLFLFFNDEMRYPLKVRAVYRPKASSFATAAVSDEVTIGRLRHPCTQTFLTVPRTVKAGRSFTAGVRVYPNPGVGRVTMVVQERIAGSTAFRTIWTKTVQTGETGAAAVRITPKAKKTYRVRAVFAGNAWGAGSRSAWKTYTAQ